MYLAAQFLGIMNQKIKIDIHKIPQHIAVIMDGNGRWAQKAGKERVFGHQNGVNAVKDTVEGCRELGVKFLTLYAFSTENWNRPVDEVNALMELLVQSIVNETDNLQKNDIRLNFIGDITRLPENCKKTLFEVINQTANNKSMTLTLALSYSGRWDIVNAFKSIAQGLINGELTPDKINEQLIQDHLSTAKMPDPELIIRTSGEFRISNFLLWQIAYSEIYITETLWPEFRKEHLEEALRDYQSRERRFGKTGDQLKTETVSR